jgi:hypothetical protein
VYFGSGVVENSLTVSLSNSSNETSGFASFTGYGGFNANGSISIPELTAASGSLCPGDCTASGAGAFSGAFAESALISYGISGVSSNFSDTGSINTTVPYSAGYINADGGEGATLYGGSEGL